MNVPALPTVAHYLEHFAERTPDTPLVIHDGVSLSYGDAALRVRRLAGALLSSGVVGGDRVAVYSAPHATCLLLYLAAASIGAVFVGISPKQRPREIQRVLEDARPRMLFFVGPQHQDHAVKLADAAERLADCPEIVTLRATSVRPWTTIKSFADERTSSDESFAAARSAVDAGDPVAIVYTSGSTGVPRGALLTNGPMTRAYAIQADRWYDERPVGVADLPVHHLGFVGDNCTALLVAGGTVHVIERWTPERVLDLVEAERLTFWWTQTTMLLLAARSHRWATTDLSSLYRIAFGGAPITAFLRDALGATGIPLGHGYGMTEVHGNITYTDRDAPLEVIAETIGRPDPRFELVVADDRGEPCPVGEPGEILIRSDTLFGGYRKSSGEIDPARDARGWYHSGDLALERPDGNLELVGRKDDMFKSGGFNVYPREVERVLESHPGVSVAAVVSVDDPTWSQVGHAYALLSGDADLDEDALREYASQHLANYKVPKRFLFPGELPLLPSGKVDKRALERTAASS
jgi:acyl-CoA synthetase (AMP-forming)/AMP-acid ligase II